MPPRTPIVAIVGRPNVGKSTLFNRIVGKQQAVVEDEPGVTRDRNYARVERFDIPFMLVDTGGFEANTEDTLAKLVSEQVRVAIEEADIVFALFDGKAGLHPGDHDIVRLLRPLHDEGKPIYFMVNKCDGKEQHLQSADFYSLGVEPIIDISALHGLHVSTVVRESLSELPQYDSLLQSWEDKQERERIAEEEAAAQIAEMMALVEEDEEDDGEGTLPLSEAPNGVAEEETDDFVIPVSFAPVFVPGQTLDPRSGALMTAEDYDGRYGLQELVGRPKMIGSLADSDVDEQAEKEIVDTVPELIRVAILGRPNVGKSTLVNTLSGEQRAITSDVAGTTRDTLDLQLKRDGQAFVLVDTAGIRKKARISDRVEQYSAMRSLRALSEADVAVVVIDAERGVSTQDVKIAGLAHEQGKGIVIAVNKWDLVEKDHLTIKKYTREIQAELKFAPYADIVFVSAKTGRRCPKIIEAVRQAAISRERRVPTGVLNKVIRKAITRNSLPVYRGRPLKLYFSAQVGTSPPRFILFFNHPRAVHFSYLRFLKNALREAFGYAGTDIKLVARKHRQSS